MFLYSLFL